MVFLYDVFKNISEGEFATQTCLQGKFGEEIGSDQFGGCIMFHAPIPSANMVIGRIEYIEVRGIIIKSQRSLQGCPYNECVLSLCC